MQEVIELSESENENLWVRQGEHGLSSITLFNHLTMGYKISLGGSEKSHPHDPDDFRRCHLLLKAVPQFKERLHEAKNISPTWAKLVDNWETLEKMLEEEDKGMYDFMRKLGA